MDKNTFYGHGKLLLTAEYFVLDGAKALALPTQLGQHLRLQNLSGSNNLLYWVALNNKRQPWLKTVLDKRDFSCVGTADDATMRLSRALSFCRNLNPAFLNNNNDVAVETQLEFPNEWGLGSSSTFIYCLAAWAQVNAYELLEKTLGGSGYDVACAGAHKPILYQRNEFSPIMEEVNWNPVFKHHIYFAYQGKKKLSSEAITHYKNNMRNKGATIQALNKITKQVLSCATLSEFEQLLMAHEEIIAKSLSLPKVKEERFVDFNGAVKSLGAWGGDFVLLTHTGPRETLATYLRSKNIDTLLNWDEMILSL
ncbi:MAG: GHMP kinase [Bacteroidetes bacterium]|nr:GHMP kinase [Bacteroidota bacterium]